MTAQPLECVIKESGKCIGFACPKCHILHTTAIYGGGPYVRDAARESAERCCCERPCEICMAKCEKHWLICVSCRNAKQAAKDRAAYDAAPKKMLAEYVSDHPDGMLYSDSFGGDNYRHADCVEDGDLVPDSLVWCCDPVDLHIEARHVLDSALEDHHEDAGDGVDQDGLQKLLDEWCAKQGVRSWERGKFALHPDDVAALAKEDE